MGENVPLNEVLGENADLIRAKYINELTASSLDPALARIPANKQEELRRITQEIANDPDFLALEKVRMDTFNKMLEDGRLDKQELIAIKLNAAPGFAEYKDFVDKKLEEEGFIINETVSKKNALTGEMVTYSRQRDTNPFAAFVHELLTESLESTTQEKTGVKPAEIPAAYEPSAITLNTR